MVVAALGCGVFSSSRDREIVKVERKLKRAKSRDIIRENLIWSTQDLSLG